MVCYSFFSTVKQNSMMRVMSHFSVFLADQIGVILVGEYAWNCAYFELKGCHNLCCLDWILQIFEDIYRKGKWDTWVGVKWATSFVDMYTYFPYKYAAMFEVTFILIWRNDPRARYAIFSRWLHRGQVGHMVWGQMGSTETHVSSDMQICSCRHANIPNAYI